MAGRGSDADDGRVPRQRHRALLLAAASLLLTSIPVGMLSAAHAGEDRAAEPSLPHAANGQEAIRLLGNQLDEAAALNGLTPARLREVLSSDPTAWVDPTARVYYVEPVATSAGGSVEPPQEVAPFPLAQTFLLHSRAASTHKLFLDFDGTTVSGTAWNDAPFNLPDAFYSGYSLDGDPTTFTDPEKEEVQKVWQRVAEDFAAFDVDVTTEDPGAAAIDRTDLADQNFGTRAMISGNGTASSTICSDNCGGIAYLSVFDEVAPDHSYYQPAWVFSHLLGPNDTKNIAEATSHEVGHNFGINHDGTSSLGYYTGHNMWAPIMGVGYNRPVVQWSKGEYADANNTVEDDLSIIANGGAPVIADDAGGTLFTASTDTSGPKLITSPGDQDIYFLGSCSGALTIAETPPAPATPSPNLDVQLDLLDSGGTVVASDNPAAAYVNRDLATGLSATIATNVPAGSYFLRVDGVGTGDPANTGYSDYGSLGAYALAVTGTCSAGAGMPGLPRSLAAVGNGPARSAQVTWNSPGDIGVGAVTSYTVFLDGAQVGTTATPGATLSGLTLGKTYDVAVSATNSAGTGPLAHTAVTVVDKPSAATITKAKSGRPGGKKTAKVSWTAPTSTGGLALTGYQVLVFKKGVLFKTFSVPAGKTSYKAKLKAGKYQFAVVALNAAGAGPQSPLSKQVTAR